MKLSKHIKWLKEHLESQMTGTEEQLWASCEGSKFDNLDQETLELGWDLGRIEMLTEVLDFIDTLENPVKGDL